MNTSKHEKSTTFELMKNISIIVVLFCEREGTSQALIWITINRTTININNMDLLLRAIVVPQNVRK